MSLVRVIKREDGGVSVIHPVRPLKKDETWDEYFSKATPDGAIYEDMESSQLPQTREDRDAWELGDDKKVKVNAAKKSEIDKKKQDKVDEEEALDELIKDKVESKKQV